MSMYGLKHGAFAHTEHLRFTKVNIEFSKYVTMYYPLLYIILCVQSFVCPIKFELKPTSPFLGMKNRLRIYLYDKMDDFSIQIGKSPYNVVTFVFYLIHFFYYKHTR